jgi:hypothetical protein
MGQWDIGHWGVLKITPLSLGPCPISHARCAESPTDPGENIASLFPDFGPEIQDLYL